MTDHAQREHSIYSPSAFSMWSNCPGSAQLTKDMPREDSDASLRGTWMHERAEEIIQEYLLSSKYIWIYNDGDEFNTDANKEAIVKATDYVQSLIDNMSLFETPEVVLEAKVSLDVVGFEEIYGTADVMIYDADDRHMVVADYKFGHGLVDPVDNGQLYIYALGSALSVEGETPETIDIVVIQPADLRNPFKTHRVTMAELLDWCTEVLTPAATLAMSEDPPVIPGEAQCKWCPKSGDCDAQRDKNLGAFDMYRHEAPETDELQHAMSIIPEMEIFIEGVRNQAYKKLMNGGAVHGYKVVKSVTKRKWADPDRAEKWLAARKIPKDQRTETKVVSITKAEKLVGDKLKGNKVLQTNFAKLINKPEGKNVMAKSDDPRQEVTIGNPILDGDMDI